LGRRESGLAFLPSRSRRYAGDFGSLFWSKRRGARWSTFFAGSAGALRSLRLFLFFDLTGSDINDQLAELYRVARAFETFGRHGYTHLALTPHFEQ
jgi:hypothetical protein